MSDITSYLTSLMEAKYGEEVRESIRDSLLAMYNDIVGLKSREELYMMNDEALNTAILNAILSSSSQIVTGVTMTWIDNDDNNGFVHGLWRRQNGSNSLVFETKNLGGHLSHLYGTCNTEASTATKTVTIANTYRESTNPGDFVITAGTLIFVKFTYANTSEGPIYININGYTDINGVSNNPALLNLDGRTITGSTSLWQSQRVVPLIFDGTQWHIVSMRD